MKTVCISRDMLISIQVAEWPLLKLKKVHNGLTFHQDNQLEIVTLQTDMEIQYLTSYFKRM